MLPQPPFRLPGGTHQSRRDPSIHGSLRLTVNTTNFVPRPTHPWHKTTRRKEEHNYCQAKRLQGNARAKPLRDIGELRRKARSNGCLMWSSSSHIARGHWANTQPSAVRPMRLSNALTSTECCPLAVSSATPYPKQDSSEPQRPRKGKASQPVADGMQIVKKNWCPNPPNRDTVTRKKVAPFTQ